LAAKFTVKRRPQTVLSAAIKRRRSFAWVPPWAWRDAQYKCQQYSHGCSDQSRSTSDGLLWLLEPVSKVVNEASQIKSAPPTTKTTCRPHGSAASGFVKHAQGSTHKQPRALVCVVQT
jgi:hypothetical protein